MAKPELQRLKVVGESLIEASQQINKEELDNKQIRRFNNSVKRITKELTDIQRLYR